MKIENGLSLAVVCSLVLLAGCKKEEDVSAAWVSVLRQCVASDQLANKILYLGPSNSLGPGTLWRREPTGGMFLRYALSDAIANRARRDRLILPGVDATCSGTKAASWSLQPSVLLELKLAPLNAQVSADLNKAKSVTASVAGWSLDQIREGPFEEWLSSNLTSPYAVDARRDSRVVEVRAIRVVGFTAALHFTTSDATSLKVKYSGSNLLTADLGVGLAATWKDETTLELTSTNPFYIGGEVYPLKGGTFGSFNGPLFDQDVDLGSMAVKGTDDVR
jgi:hypothetical protein